MSPASAQRRKRGLNPIPKENVAFTALPDQAPPASFASVARVNPVWGARKWEEKSLSHKFVKGKARWRWLHQAASLQQDSEGCRHLSLARSGGPKAPPE